MSEQPENLDNPVTVGGDLDQPRDPNEPGGFVYQDENAVASEQPPAQNPPVDPQQGEPVVEPDGAADDDAEDDGEAEPDANPGDSTRAI